MIPHDVFIYGTGTMARDIYRVLTAGAHHVIGFIDHLNHIIVPEGAVYRPEMAPHPHAYGDTVILGIHNNCTNVYEIKRRVEALNYKTISLVELYDDFGDELGDRYWLTKRSFYDPIAVSSTILERGGDVWADKKSRELYWRILGHRLGYKWSPIIPDGDIYCPRDVPARRDPLRMIDCGAYDGDSLLGIDAVAFEPDPVSFSKLRARGISAWPCGVYSSTCQMRFNAQGDRASALSKFGSSIIQCVALDDVLPNFAPDLIKMDIEGAEMEALKGAGKIINKYLPQLAVSVYHRPGHLWQIPALVEQIAPGKYNHYLRVHGYNTFDSVLYSVPKES